MVHTLPGQAAKLRDDVTDLWHRRTAEEAVYAMLLLIDKAATWMKSSGSTDRCESHEVR